MDGIISYKMCAMQNCGITLNGMDFNIFLTGYGHMSRTSFNTCIKNNFGF
jgi:hypothetical protein